MPLYWYDTQTRHATGTEAEALLAQGWTLMPDAPSYNPATQAPPEWNKTTHQWEVRALHADELEAIELAKIKASLAAKAVVLDGWSVDAAAEVLTWDSKTQTQKNAVLKALIDRLGKFMSNAADIIRTM